MKTPNAKKLMYFLAVYKAEEGGFWSRFVEFPAADQGETLEDAVTQATVFLEGIVKDYAKNMKAPLPEPLTIEEFKKKLDPSDGEPVCIVPIFVYPPSPAVRIQLTAKANQIAELDAYAREHNLTRSELMISSTLDYIRRNA